MLGRLAPGTSREQLEAELASLYRNVAYELRGEEGVRGLEQVGFRTIVVDAHQDLIRNVRLPLFLLWGAVSFVLLIGCVNIANLMLARSEARLPEMATRAALGAGRLRLVRQILGEATVIGVLGGVVGIGLASIVLPLLGVVELSPTTNTDGDTAGAMALAKSTSPLRAWTSRSPLGRPRMKRGRSSTSISKTCEIDWPRKSRVDRPRMFIERASAPKPPWVMPVMRPLPSSATAASGSTSRNSGERASLSTQSLRVRLIRLASSMRRAVEALEKVVAQSASRVH